RWWVLAALAVLVIYGWWATGLRPFTAPALVVTLATGGVVLAVGARTGRRRPGGTEKPSPPVAAAGLAVWGVLVLALAAWEVAAFVQLPRSAHPTLSALANLAFESHPVRAAAFVLWIAAGYGMARR
ncbi:MAG TPA: hypothetical protein VHL54_10145, partial [Actinomycetota bacterium]|nr:hypothetical protein [Actinomycetota bacterium]